MNKAIIDRQQRHAMDQPLARANDPEAGYFWTSFPWKFGLTVNQ